jgi:hypothetical protein
MRVRILVLLTGAMALSGCASLISAYNDQFECPRSKGDQPCEQTSKAYLRAMAKQGLPQPPDPGRYTHPGDSADGWVPPVKTVWIGPYVDSAGRRHEPAVLRIVVMPGPSILKPEPEFLVPPVPEVADDGSTLEPPVPPAEASPTGQSRGTPTPRTRTPPRNAPLRAGGGIGSTGGTGLGTTPQTVPSGGFSIPGF